MVSKGRQHRPVGVHNQNAKLAPEEIRLIREERAYGDSYRKIAARRGLHHSTIARILNGQTWPHVR